MHAGWNLLMKRSGDRLISGWAIATTGGLASLPFLVVLGIPDTSVWPNVIASGLVHVGYVSALAAAYERADLSVAYPLARGISPVLIGAGAALFLDDRLSGAGWAGVALTSAGLLFVALHALKLEGLEWAAVTGLFITTYTLIDTAGARADDEALRYVLALFVVHSAWFVPVILFRRGWSALAAVMRAEGGRMFLGGALSVGAYALVLAAALTSPIGGVSAVRETSVVFGSLAGWLLLNEDLGLRRTVGAAAVAGGVAVLALA